MRFKLVGCLTTAAIYCLSITSVAAIDVIPNQSAQSTQTIALDPLRVIEREQRKIEREQRKRERERRIEMRRQERERRRLQWLQEMERRQKEQEAARQAASEQQRLEAERRRQYFESLSPEQQKAYLAEQEARRIQAVKAFGTVLQMMFSGGVGSGQQNDSQLEPCYEEDLSHFASGKNCRSGF